MWYIIQTAVGREESVCEKCKHAFPAGTYRRIFVPKYMVMKKYQGAWHEERKVLFPGYIIVDSDDGEPIKEILTGSLARIASPVCVGRDFVPVYPEEEQFLDSLLGMNDTVGVSRGDIVDGEFDIKEGPLRQRSFCIRKIDRHRRLANIEFYLYGQNRQAQVALEIVRKS